MRKLFIFLSLSILVFSCDDKSDQVIIPLSGGIVNISAKATLSGNFSLTSLSSTTVLFDAESCDTDNMHDITVNQSRLTINTPGLYLIVVNADISNSATTGTRILSVMLNNTNPAIAISTIDYTGGTVESAVSISQLYKFTKGDFIEFQIWHNTGVGVSLLANSSFSVARLGD